MDNRKIRDILRLCKALLFSPLYLPHLLVYASQTSGGGKTLINSDIDRITYQTGLDNLPKWMTLLNLLHNNKYYRNIFYHRIGAKTQAFLSWYRPGDRYFIIGKNVRIGKGFWIAHPYSTIIAAESIGDNFSCIHCTTLGNTPQGKPTIGNNVQLGANVTIIGPVHIGNNVVIGAGSVVVKNIPDNCIAAGNPARIIRQI